MAVDTRMLVLVEGESDAAAVNALARRRGWDLAHGGIQVVSARGVTNFAHVLRDFREAHPHAGTCGMYDIAEERFVRRALAGAGYAIDAQSALDPFGFFSCAADLEDELIRALGTEAVEQALEAESELASFRRFQAMPQHRGEPPHRQLHRFLGTRATRKIRLAERLVSAMDAALLPRPLASLADRLERQLKDYAPGKSS